MRIASLEARQDQADAGSGKQEERVARLKLQLDEAAESLIKMEKGLAVSHQRSRGGGGREPHQDGEGPCGESSEGQGGADASAFHRLRGRLHCPAVVRVLGSLSTPPALRIY